MTHSQRVQADKLRSCLIANGALILCNHCACTVSCSLNTAHFPLEAQVQTKGKDAVQGTNDMQLSFVWVATAWCEAATEDGSHAGSLQMHYYSASSGCTASHTRLGMYQLYALNRGSSTPSGNVFQL